MYYGTEQPLMGPLAVIDLEGSYGIEPDGSGTRQQAGDRYLREAMFGPRYPRKAGPGGMLAGVAGLDPLMPGFAPGSAGGTAKFGRTPTFKELKELIELRHANPVLALGDIQVSSVGIRPGSLALRAGESVVAWTRTLTTVSGPVCALIVVNVSDHRARGWTVQLTPAFATFTQLSRIDGRPARPTVTGALMITPPIQGDQPTVVLTIAPYAVQVYLAGAVSAR